LCGSWWWNWGYAWAQVPCASVRHGISGQCRQFRNLLLGNADPDTRHICLLLCRRLNQSDGITRLLSNRW